MLMVNRLQILYFILSMPAYLVHPYMIWGIIAIGVLSQCNLMILSRWFASKYAAKGFQGFVQLFGERGVRFLAFAALFPVFVKVTVLTLGYVEIVQMFIFPSMDKIWLLLSVFVTCFYVAQQGIEKTIRFVVIAFLCTIWMIVLFFPFILPPLATYSNLLPLVPTEWSLQSWKGLLIVWAALSGPEYLICLAPWFNSNHNLIKYLTLGNALSILEYLLLFAASLSFFGSDYLRISNFPVVQIIRYLQSPVFERIDIILICIHLFHFVFAAALLLLYFYGAVRIIVGKWHEQTTRRGFVLASMAVLACMMIINQWFWTTGEEQYKWLALQVWLGASTYLLVPGLLLLAMKIKERLQA